MPRRDRDKTTGLPIPSPVVPDTTICFTIQVPDAPEYRSALKGALSSLGHAWTWSQTRGEDNQASFDAAELWRARIQEAFYSSECGAEPMSCGDVADCIENNAQARAAVQAVASTAPVGGYTYPPGTPLTPGQMTARLNEIDGCNQDEFWAQVEQYVDFMVTLGADVLEQIESYSNALEAGENVPMGQFLGKLKNSSTAGKVIEFLEWALEVIQEAYIAADTTANRNDIKCALFCAGQDDCIITIQDTLDVLNERLGGLLTPGDLNDLPSMVDAFTTAAFNPALALDLWILFLMGSAQTAGMFGLENIDETLNMILALAVNDANNDWELLCDECPPPDDCLDMTASENGFTPVIGSYAIYHPGQGWGPNSGRFRMSIEKVIVGTISTVIVKTNMPVPFASIRSHFGTTGGSTPPQSLVVTTEGSQTVYTTNIPSGLSNGVFISISGGTGSINALARIEEVCIIMA